MEDLTPMEQTTETTDRLLAALLAAGSAQIDPEGSTAIMLLFCARQTPAEA